MDDEVKIHTSLHGQIIDEASVALSIEQVQTVTCSLELGSDINSKLTGLHIELETDFEVADSDILKLEYPQEAAANFESVLSPDSDLQVDSSSILITGLKTPKIDLMNFKNHYSTRPISPILLSLFDSQSRPLLAC